MEPRDLKFDKMSFRVNDPSENSSGSLHKMREWFQIDYVHYAHVMMADGAVHRIPQITEVSTLKAALTIDGGEMFELPVLKR